MSAQIAKNKPFVYGLTGGIASGKSTAVNFFIEKGVKVFDSDAYVKSLWKENTELINIVNEKYNIDIKTPEGKKRLADIIFNDDFEKAFVNSLVHPYVFTKIDHFINENINEDFLIIDMPLLFEVGYDSRVDKTILIYTTPRQQLKRLMSRDNIEKDEAFKKIKAQLSIKDKRHMSNYIINNTKDIDRLYKKLELMYEVMKNESKQ